VTLLPRKPQDSPNPPAGALRVAIADHLEAHQRTIVQQWVKRLRIDLKLPSATGLPSPVSSALTTERLGQLLRATASALRTGDFSDALERAAANHHEILDSVQGVWALTTKLGIFGDVVRRSVLENPLLPPVETLYLLDRTFTKLTSESVFLLVTRRKVGLNRLSRHHEELRETADAILASSPVGILVTDRDGIITFFNQAQERISGVTRTAVLGKKIYIDYARRSEPEFRAAFTRAIQHGETSYFKRRHYLGRQGEQFLDVLMGPITDHAGEIIGTIHVCQDVTDKTELEQKLLKQNQKLQAKVKELEEAYTYIGKVNRQFASLIDISNTLSSQLSLDKILDFIVRSAAMLTKARLTTLRQLRGEDLILLAQYGLDPKELPKYRSTTIHQSVIGRVIRERRQILIVDITREEQFRWPELRKNLGLRSLVSVPLHSRGKVVGVLSIHLAESRTFSNLELNFLMALASQAALAIEIEQTLAPVRAAKKKTLPAIPSPASATPTPAL
jgi:PAS domain S-box-containing protein